MGLVRDKQLISVKRPECYKVVHRLSDMDRSLLKDLVRTVTDLCPRVYCMIWDMRFIH